MALLFLEGFEGYSSITSMLNTGTTNPVRFSFSAGSANTFALNTTTYRTTQVTSANSRSLYIYAQSQSGVRYNYDNFTLPAKTEVIIGVAIYKNTNSASTASIISIGGINTSGRGIALAINSSNQIYAAIPTSYGGPSTSLGIASQTISNFTWHYVEVRAKLSATVGEFEVYLDGVQVLNLTNVNTATGSITSYESFGLGCSADQPLDMLFDDLYAVDTLGADNNTFLGPISVYSLVPTSNASSTQLTANTGANWDAVNDVTEDNATTYVSTLNTGDKDFYNFQALPGSVTSVKGVQIKARSTLGTSGTRKLKLNIKNGINTITSGLKTLVLGTWTQDHFISDTAPDGSAWTPANVNSTEGGVEAG